MSDGIAKTFSVLLHSTEVGPCVVHSGSVDEAISEPTTANLVIVADAAIDIDAAIGKPATIEWQVDGAPTRYFHLVVSRVEYIGLRTGKYTYGVSLSHELDLLRLRTDVRMFQQMDAKEIVSAVLAGAQLDSGHYAWKNARALAKRDYCVQYRESDFAFISRLLEFEGIFYLITHDDSTTQVTFADDPSAFEVIAEAEEVPFTDALGWKWGVQDFYVEAVSTPDRVCLNDWNFKKTQMKLRSEEKIGDAPQGLVYEYPGGFFTQEDGKALAQIRLEELISQKSVAGGMSDCLPFHPGGWFKLTGTSREALSQEYVLRRVGHRFTHPFHQEERANRPTYTNTFICAPRDLPYRPPRNTPVPRMAGSHSAVVTGASGEEIHTEKLGRMKGKFYWDRVGKDDDTSSCWMRTSQLPIGGSMMLPRVGWEMLVRYLDGDLDRPHAMCRVDHAAHPAPYKYPGAKTSMALKTLSSPGGAKNNELKLEDGGGGMGFSMNAAKNHAENTGNNKSETIGANEKLDIGVDYATEVGANQKVSIGASHTATISADEGFGVTGDRTKSVGGSETLSVSGAASAKITGSDTESTGGTHMTVAALGVSKSCKGSHTLTVGGSLITAAASGCALTVIGAKSESISGSKLVASAAAVGETVAGAIAITVGGAVINAAAANRTGSAKGANAVTVGGAAVVSSGDKIAIKAKTIKIIVGGMANIIGGGGTINMTPGTCAFLGMVTVKGALKIAGSPNLVSVG